MTREDELKKEIEAYEHIFEKCNHCSSDEYANIISCEAHYGDYESYIQNCSELKGIQEERERIRTELNLKFIRNVAHIDMIISEKDIEQVFKKYSQSNNGFCPCKFPLPSASSPSYCNKCGKIISQSNPNTNSSSVKTTKKTNNTVLVGQLGNDKLSNPEQSVMRNTAVPTERILSSNDGKSGRDTLPIKHRCLKHDTYHRINGKDGLPYASCYYDEES